MNALPQPAPERRRLAWLLLAAALVVCGVAAGLLIGHASSPNAGQRQRQEVAGPPQIGAKFPKAADVYLPDVTVDLIGVQWLQGQAQWRCDKSAANMVQAPAKNDMTCRPPSSSASISVLYDDDAQIRSISATCNQPPGDPGCRTLFTALAELVAHKDPQLREQAADWVGANVDRDATTAIGTLRLITTLQPHRLSVYPLE